jgi:hypothetical protein
MIEVLILFCWGLGYSDMFHIYYQKIHIARSRVFKNFFYVFIVSEFDLLI